MIVSENEILFWKHISLRIATIVKINAKSVQNKHCNILLYYDAIAMTAAYVPTYLVLTMYFRNTLLYVSILPGWPVDLCPANTRTTTNNSQAERTAKRSNAAPSLKKTSPTSPMT